jgi:signal transduction histidine kinase
MLTVRHDETDVIAGLEAGADDYVVKDAPGEVILGRVRRLIEFRQMSSLAVLNHQLAQVGRLVAGIVHEIRGPLAVIRGNAELLRARFDSGDEDAQWIESILRNSRLLQIRLDHLMATVRNTSADLEIIDLGPLLREAVDLFVKGLPTLDRPIRVELECGTSVPKVQVDPGRLMQVLFNLLGNAYDAVTRASPGGQILVRASSARSDGKAWVTVDVIDDGPGISETYIDRIFEPFFTTRQDGTGYGLYLASEIAKEQGGRLTARNNSGSGATFTTWLPAAEQDAGGPIDPANPA